MTSWKPKSPNAMNASETLKRGSGKTGGSQAEAGCSGGLSPISCQKLRGLHHENVEIRLFKRISNSEYGKKVLEFGCGNWFGTFLINKYFQPIEIHSIDLDPRMIQKAKKKYRDLVKFQVAEVTDLPFSDSEFDAIINFGIIHHVTNWNKAIEECSRVLKSGGEFISEDLSTETWNLLITRIFRILLEHPYKSMFSIPQFLSWLKKQKLRIRSFYSKYSFLFPFFFSYCNKSLTQYPKII